MDLEADIRMWKYRSPDSSSPKFLSRSDGSERGPSRAEIFKEIIQNGRHFHMSSVWPDCWIIVQHLAIYLNENLPNGTQNLPK